MALLLEGPFGFDRWHGMVRITDAGGQVICMALGDFNDHALLACEYRAKLRVERIESAPKLVAIRA